VEQRLRNPVVKKMSSVEKIKKECCKKSESSKKNSHEGCDGACKVLVAVIQLFY
jgi:hypothetical protein